MKCECELINLIISVLLNIHHSFFIFFDFMGQSFVILTIYKNKIK